MRYKVAGRISIIAFLLLTFLGAANRPGSAGEFDRAELDDLQQPIVTERFVMPERGVSSHRGENYAHPENTLAAFREAIRLGAHQIELDVHLTHFGDLVVIHDIDVSRTTDGEGDVREMTLEEIKALDAGLWKNPRFMGERIPTLEEALEIMPRTVWLNIHLKGGYELGAAVAKTVLRHGREHQAFLAAERDAANGARSVFEDILICNMERQGGDVERYIADTIEHGDAFIQLHHRHQPPTPEQIQRLKNAGVRINYFGTNDPDELEWLYELGIDFPLVDDLAPMMERAKELGVEPLMSAE